MSEIDQLHAENDELRRRAREALNRLGSMEAFDAPRAVDKRYDEELLARIDYARVALAALQGGAK